MPNNRIREKGQFYAILDTGYVRLKAWRESALALIEGGCHLLQVRAKNETHEQRRTLVEAVIPLTLAAGIPLIVNDDVELARQFPGVGLHIGQDDIPPATARELLGPDRILGWSTHSIAQARDAIRQANLLNYFAVGPIFATPTKPDYPAVGLNLIQQVRDMQPPVPFFCIGGITRQNLGAVMAAGAPNVVVVSDVLTAADPKGATMEIVERVNCESPDRRQGGDGTGR